MKKIKQITELMITAFYGFCMSLADSVPGVSGGTVAFIMGFYDNFINSLNNVIYGKKELKIKGIKYLIKLGMGWIVGMALTSIVLTSVFEKHIYKVSSLFLGFTIFAIILIVREEKANLKGKYKYLPFTLVGAILVLTITFLNPVTGGQVDVDVTNLNFGLSMYVFVAGMIAISAMVLPGISGSTLLLIFGLYMPIISAIKEFLHLNFDYLPVLAIFGVGVLAGIVLVIKLIKIALEKYRSQTVYTIIGLMIGSLYAIIMGATTLKIQRPAMSLSTFNVIFFIIGGIVIFGMQILKNKFDNKTNKISVGKLLKGKGKY